MMIRCENLEHTNDVKKIEDKKHCVTAIRLKNLFIRSPSFHRLLSLKATDVMIEWNDWTLVVNPTRGAFSTSNAKRFLSVVIHALWASILSKWLRRRQRHANNTSHNAQSNGMKNTFSHWKMNESRSACVCFHMHASDKTNRKDVENVEELRLNIRYFEWCENAGKSSAMHATQK